MKRKVLLFAPGLDPSGRSYQGVRDYVLSGVLLRGVPVVVFVLLLFKPGLSIASERLGLFDAYRLALENHEVIMLAREALRRTEVDIEKAFSEVLPRVTLDGNYIRYTEKKFVGPFLIQPEDNIRFEARIEQPLFSGGKEWSLIRQARKRALGSREDLEATKELVAIETARAYYAALRGRKNVEIKEASLNRAKEQLRVARARLKAGTATRALVLRAEAEVSGITAELARARNELNNAKDRLRRLTGFQGPFDVYDPPQEESGGLSLDELLEKALDFRRDYLRKRIDEEIAEEGITYAKGNFMPNLKIEGVYSYRDQSPATSFLLRESIYVGLSVSFPVFEGGLRRAELKEARSLLREAELARINYRRDIELEIREAYNNMLSLGPVIDSFEKQVAFARENYNMVFKQFQYGLADSMDVIDANTTLVEAELGLMSAEYDHELAVLELKKRAGLLLGEVASKIKGDGR